MSENGEPLSPKELLQERTERAARDAWLAVHELVGLENNPDACDFVAEQERHLNSIKTNIDLILSHIAVRRPLLRAVS